MRVLFDINVVLDIVGNREPFYAASRDAFLKVIEAGGETLMAAHAFPTLFYLLGTGTTAGQRDAAMKWILSSFKVAQVGQSEIDAAHESSMADFEDAVVVAAAVSADCDFILTRNQRDFAGGQVEVMSPQEWLALRK